MIHTPSLRAFLTDAAKLAVTLVGSAVLADYAAENTRLRERNRALELARIRYEQLLRNAYADLAAMQPSTDDLSELAGVGDLGDCLYLWGGEVR